MFINHNSNFNFNYDAASTINDGMSMITSQDDAYYSMSSLVDSKISTTKISKLNFNNLN